MEKKQIIKKLSAFSIGPIVGAFINFITTPMITYFIAPEEYGKANMFTVAIAITQLVVFLGMDQAYAKRYYDVKDRSSLFINSLTPAIILIVLCEIVAVFIKGTIGKWLFDSEYELSCVYALMAIVPALAVERFLLLSIRMSQHGKLYSMMTIMSKLLVLLVTILCFVTYEKSFRSVILGTTIAQIVFAVLLCIVQGKKINIDPNKINITEIKSLLTFGLPLVPSTILGWILTGMDKVMLRSLATYDELGLYGVAAKIAAVLTIVQTCFATFWSPLAYQWNSNNVSTERYTKVGRIIAAVMSVLFAVILLVKDCLFLIFPSSYRVASTIVPFLLFTPIMYTISEVTVMGIYFHEKTTKMIIVSIVSGAVNLLLNRLLIPMLGPKGAALATGISYITFFWIRTILSRKLWYKFKLEAYVVVTLILLVDATVSTFLFGWIVYTTNIICLLILIFYFRKEINHLVLMFFETVKPKNTKIESSL